MKIVVIIPTYNEKVNIEKMLPLLEKEVFPKIKNNEMHILIADDKSPDGTQDVVKAEMKQYKNIHLLEGNREGLGAAYVRAMKYAMEHLKADAVMEFDADFQHDPHDIPRLVAAMDEGYDYVIGSRYVPGGSIPKEWGLDRKIKSVFGSLFARIVLFTFSIHDMTSGFKLTKISLLKKVDLDKLYSKNYAYKIHMLYELVNRGAKVKEVPIIFYERTKGKSKMDPNDLYESFTLVLRLRFRDSARFMKFFIIGCTGFIVQIIVQEGSYRLGLTHALAQMLVSYGIVQDVVAVSNFFAAAFGAEAAILSNFLWNNFWTFRDTHAIEQKSSFLVRIVKFNLTSLASILLQAVAVFVGVKVLGTNISILSFVIPTRILVLLPTIIFIILPLNYIIYNKLIWKTHHLKTEK